MAPPPALHAPLAVRPSCPCRHPALTSLHLCPGRFAARTVLPSCHVNHPVSCTPSIQGDCFRLGHSREQRIPALTELTGSGQRKAHQNDDEKIRLRQGVIKVTEGARGRRTGCGCWDEGGTQLCTGSKWAEAGGSEQDTEACGSQVGAGEEGGTPARRRTSLPG